MGTNFFACHGCYSYLFILSRCLHVDSCICSGCLCSWKTFRWMLILLGVTSGSCSGAAPPLPTPKHQAKAKQTQHSTGRFKGVAWAATTAQSRAACAGYLNWPPPVPAHGGQLLSVTGQPVAITSHSVDSASAVVVRLPSTRQWPLLNF
jgi:hypothetical protein